MQMAELRLVLPHKNLSIFSTTHERVITMSFSFSLSCVYFFYLLDRACMLIVTVKTIGAISNIPEFDCTVFSASQKAVIFQELQTI